MTVAEGVVELFKTETPRNLRMVGSAVGDWMRVSLTLNFRADSARTRTSVSTSASRSDWLGTLWLSSTASLADHQPRV